MIIKVISLIVILIVCVQPKDKNKGFSLVGNPLIAAHSCADNDNVTVQYEPGRSPTMENQYNVYISGIEFYNYYRCELQFDSPAIVTLNKPDVARATVNKYKKNVIDIKFFAKASSLGFSVKGTTLGIIPYITSIDVNGIEFCEEPKIGFLDQFIQGYKDTAEIELSYSDDSCGRRKVQHTALIVNGEQTKPGDWPWHGAVYRTNKADVKYVCGSTLLSKNLVLTAAHCVTIRGAVVLPEIVKVVFGKYNLYVGDSDAQEREVHQIIVHEDFTTKHFDNDIALLKLSTAVTLTDYVQPACLWQYEDEKKIPYANLHGMVVGWGINENDTLTSELRRAEIPKLSDSECIKKNPLFYSTLLNDKKFCAGFGNGTSPCNGDSGGGYHVFVPDQSGDLSANPAGTWHVRGIVSLTQAKPNSNVCDPNEYVLFTDVAKYLSWIKKHLK